MAGGVVHQLGVHGIDLVQHILGPIQNLSAVTALLKTERVLAERAADVLADMGVERGSARMEAVIDSAVDGMADEAGSAPLERDVADKALELVNKIS